MVALIPANPHRDVSNWGGERLRDDKRRHCGAPPAGNANMVWVQHFNHQLAANGSSDARTTCRFGVG